MIQLPGHMDKHLAPEYLTVPVAGARRGARSKQRDDEGAPSGDEVVTTAVTTLLRSASSNIGTSATFVHWRVTR